MPASQLLIPTTTFVPAPVRQVEKLHWCATDSRSCKSKRKSLPTWLGDDGDFGNFILVRDVKIEIIPIRAALPALKGPQAS
jgi:hypothetical protein